MKLFISIIAFFSLVLMLAQCTGNKQSPLSPEAEKTYLENGKTIAAATFAELSGKLTNALEKNGVSGAVEYCSLTAIPLLDSLSKVHNATIRRTSTKLRNPVDKPTEWESGILAEFEKKAMSGEEMQPIVRKLDEHTVTFAAPIKMLPLCSKCHGAVGSDIAEGDYATIKKLYPSDTAIGYKTGELRGIWSITFNK